MKDVYDFGVPIVMLVLGFIYLFGTPKYKKSIGLKTDQTLRGKEEWKFGHKILGVTYIVYALICGAMVFVVNALSVPLNSLLVICVYGTLMLSTPFIMNFAIKKKFGVDEEVEEAKKERIEAHNAWVDDFKAQSAKKKKARQKEADRKKRVRESDKKAKQAKRAKKRK